MAISYRALTDEELAILTAKGNNPASDEIYDRYNNQLKGFVTNKLKDMYSYSNPAETEDIVSEILIRVFKGIGSFDATKGNFHGWLWTIAYNYIIQWRNTKSNKFLMKIEEEEDGTVQSGQFTNAVVSEFIDALYNTLCKLKNENNRLVLYCRNFTGMSLKEISELSGRPVNTVKSDLRRALKEYVGIFDREYGYDKGVVERFFEGSCMLESEESRLTLRDLERVMDKTARKALELRFRDNKGYKEIAAELSMSIREVQKLMTEGLTDMFSADIVRSVGVYLSKDMVKDKAIYESGLSDYIDLLYKGLLSEGYTRGDEREETDDLKKMAKLIFLSSALEKSANIEARTLGELVVWKADRLNIPLDEIAATLDYDENQLSSIINNSRHPGLEELKKLSKLLQEPQARLESLMQLAEPSIKPIENTRMAPDNRWEKFDAAMKKKIHKVLKTQKN